MVPVRTIIPSQTPLPLKHESSGSAALHANKLLPKMAPLATAICATTSTQAFATLNCEECGARAGKRISIAKKTGFVIHWMISEKPRKAPMNQVDVASPLIAAEETSRYQADVKTGMHINALKTAT